MNESDKEFLRMCVYFIEEKGDPTRYSEWNERRFMTLAPAAWCAWRDLGMAKKHLSRAIEALAVE